MAGFTKIFGNLLLSTVWNECLATKVLWITMLVLTDRDGVVESTPSGLARMAGITKEECEKGLEFLSSPDPESNSKEEEGRRILKVENGWKIINYEKYREKLNKDDQRELANERQRRYLERKRLGLPNDADDVTVTPNDAGDYKHIHRQIAESESEADLIYINNIPFDKNSWTIALDIWKAAGPWKGTKGDVETFHNARKSFEKKINKDNWPEFIQKLDWAVTASKRSGRNYLGLFYTFLEQEKWKDAQPPNELIEPEAPKQIYRLDEI